MGSEGVVIVFAEGADPVVVLGLLGFGIGVGGVRGVAHGNKIIGQVIIFMRSGRAGHWLAQYYI